MEPISLEPADRVTVTMLMDNSSDLLLASTGPAKRPAPNPAASGQVATLIEGRAPLPMIAEHGFSALVDVQRGERTIRILFDTGISPDGIIENMRRLEIDPGGIEVIVLSHGHFDHTTGMDGLIRALGRPNLPVMIHPEFWSRRRIAISGRDPIDLPTTSRPALVDAGFAVVEDRQPSFLLENTVLVTGEIDRTTDFERGLPAHEAHRDGRWQPDPLILDDQALVINVRDQGLFVLSGCGHAGIVNTARYAKKLAGVDDIHAIIGGFHLTGKAMEAAVGPTVDALADLQTNWVVPAHCTGWQATHAIAARLPDTFLPNSVGTVYEL